jgi:hypothetical protein
MGGNYWLTWKIFLKMSIGVVRSVKWLAIGWGDLGKIYLFF